MTIEKTSDFRVIYINLYTNLNQDKKPMCFGMFILNKMKIDLSLWFSYFIY